MPNAVPGPAAEVAALLPALREAAEWAGAMLHRLGDAATAPGPDGGWTPVRIVVHLAAVDAQVWTPRLRQLAAHDHPSWTWTEPDLAGGPDPGPDAAAEAFCVARTAVTETVAAMDEAALRSTGVHATFGELDAVGLLGEVLRHDAEHLASLAEAVAALSSGTAGEAGAVDG
ncbi:MAG: DinB family protein [Candidatus Limnocylindrales bacterium]